MMSETQVYIVDVGDDVALECRFHADRYSMFDHPVMWRKRQLDESSQINMLGNINDPFIQTNRYEVTFDAADEPLYELRLRISGRPHTCTPHTALTRARKHSRSVAKGGNVTSAGRQVTLCDPIWHVSSCSGEAVYELLYTSYLYVYLYLSLIGYT